ncbi:MAG: HAD hydrolase-like protein [Acidimicrobiia bacterium]
MASDRLDPGRRRDGSRDARHRRRQTGTHIFEIARSLLPDCRRMAIVGDHLESDIADGKRAGLTTILVLTGTTTLSFPASSSSAGLPRPRAVRYGML